MLRGFFMSKPTIFQVVKIFKNPGNTVLRQTQSIKEAPSHNPLNWVEWICFSHILPTTPPHAGWKQSTQQAGESTMHLAGITGRNDDRLQVIGDDQRSTRLNRECGMNPSLRGLPPHDKDFRYPRRSVSLQSIPIWIPKPERKHEPRLVKSHRGRE